MSARFDKLLILDLDETLIHSTDKQLQCPGDLKIEEYNVYKRPSVDEFISTCATWFNISEQLSVNSYQLSFSVG
ncbi:MAG: NIF family HAD-type phosphatase [Prochloraceae cyanobacterium]|nr:NIF family HAD-type phosphatase [Prochloraceae cyanobacterium]